MLTVRTVKNLGERLRQLRNESDLSLRELARRLGKVTAAHLSDIEFGRRHPSDKLLRRLATFFNVPLTELQELDSRPPIYEIKQAARKNPRYGFAFRKLMDHNVSAEEILEFVKQRRPGENEK